MTARSKRIDQLRAFREARARDLLAGRATLAEVADDFLAADAEDPLVLEGVRARYPGASDRVTAARRALAFAADRFPREARAGGRLGRLETEFALAFGRRHSLPPWVPGASCVVVVTYDPPLDLGRADDRGAEVATSVLDRR